MQNLPDGGDTEGSAVVFQGSLDVIDGKILLAHGQDELADGVFLGLAAGTGFEVAEEIRLGAAEVVAENCREHERSRENSRIVLRPVGKRYRRRKRRGEPRTGGGRGRRAGGRSGPPLLGDLVNSS